MCWYCNPEKFKLQRTKNDITVYKVLRCEIVPRNEPYELTSWYYPSFVYSLGKIRYSDITISEMPNNLSGDMNSGNCIIVTKGLHSYIDLPKLSYKCLIADSYVYSYSGWNIPVAVECIIPAGSDYAINEYGEVISSQIIPIKIIPYNKLVLAETYCDNVIKDCGDINEKFHKAYEDIYKQLNK
jgi:hypothetical protein